MHSHSSSGWHTPWHIVSVTRTQRHTKTRATVHMCTHICAHAHIYARARAHTHTHTTGFEVHPSPRPPLPSGSPDAAAPPRRRRHSESGGSWTRCSGPSVRARGWPSCQPSRSELRPQCFLFAGARGGESRRPHSELLRNAPSRSESLRVSSARYQLEPNPALEPSHCARSGLQASQRRPRILATWTDHGLRDLTPAARPDRGGSFWPAGRPATETGYERRRWAKRLAPPPRSPLPPDRRARKERAVPCLRIADPAPSGRGAAAAVRRQPAMILMLEWATPPQRIGQPLRRSLRGPTLHRRRRQPCPGWVPQRMCEGYDVT